MHHLGEAGVAIGSDFDGAMMPNFLDTAKGLPDLVKAMQAAGYGAALIQRILWQNWQDFLSKTIG